MKRPFLLPLLAAAGLALSASTACAQNLVQNPGFEDSSLAPWTTSHTGTVITSRTNYAPDVHSGNQAALFLYQGNILGNQIPGIGTFSQTLATTPGQVYTISFWAVNDQGGGLSDPLSVFWNGSLALGAPVLMPEDRTYHEYTLAAVASSSSTLLQFQSPLMDSLFAWPIGLDDVVVKPAPAPAPSALLTALMGAVPGLSILRRRLRRR